MDENIFTIKNGFKFGLGLFLAKALVEGVTRSRAMNRELDKKRFTLVVNNTEEPPK